MKRFVSLGLAIAALAGTAAVAGERAGRLDVGVQAGLSSYFGDLDGSEWGPAAAVGVDWWIHDHLALGVRGGWWSWKADDNGVGFESQPVSVSPRLTWSPWRHGWLQPYVAGGLDFVSHDPTVLDDSDTLLPNNDQSTYNENALAVFGAVGVHHELGERWVLSLEGQYHASRSDWLDGVQADTDDDGWLAVMAGVALRLGKARDSDGDGVADRDDAAPNEPEDFDGYEDADGAPDLDNDGDGVPDLRDGAPLDPEDLDGFADGDGVPDSDNDGDGVPDARDLAPDQPEDIDGWLDEDGAPDPDNDGDGILDARDRCPDEAETFNGYEDADGCPDVKPEIVVEKGAAIVLEGVTFRSGSATLTPESEGKLGEVLRTLQTVPALEIEIRGYTDSQGNADVNRRLSQQRAETVRQWLVDRGVDGGRIAARGFGADNPVADNASEAGRAQNRRIEFFRVN